jgi:hypothetical protein
MDDEGYYFFMMPPSMWSKKPHRSRHRMTIAHAAKYYPGATPILSTREVRTNLGDTSQIAMSHNKTPEMEAYHAWLVSRIGAKSEAIDNPPDEPN